MAVVRVTLGMVRRPGLRGRRAWAFAAAKFGPWIWGRLWDSGWDLVDFLVFRTWVRAWVMGVGLWSPGREDVRYDF
jgi:hypothetical protein